MKTEARYREAYERGVQFELISVDPTQFAMWCKAKGVAPGESSRAEYASAALAKRPKSSGETKTPDVAGRRSSSASRSN